MRHTRSLPNVSAGKRSHRPVHKPGDFTASPRVLLLMGLAGVIAVAAVAAARALVALITLCTNLAYHGVWSFAALPDAPAPWGRLIVLAPVAGCLVIGLMARFGSEKIRGHGIPEAIEAILIGKSRISAKVALLKPISSAISIGTGGPFGAEGPIIMTGGAIGSLLAQVVHLSSTERKALLVAGAAAGMTAIFATPLAALLLAVELLLFEWKPRSFLPVLVAVAVAIAARPFAFEAGPIFPFAGSMALGGWSMPAWALLGLVAGLGSGVLTAMVYGFEDLFQRLPIHWMWWPMIGGLAIGLGGLVEPAALGVGYDNIRHLLDGTLHGQAAVWLLVVKALIWAIALGSGTSGGVLAPLLIFGGVVGTLAAQVLPTADPGFWALLGMAAMMGGTMRAPLTATLFAVELTGDGQALLPLLVSCGAAYATTVLLLKRSILTEKVARKGLHITREYHVDPFDQCWVKDVMVRDVAVMPAAMTAQEALQFFTTHEHRHKTYPIVDEEHRLVGMISRADILGLLRTAGEGELPGSVAELTDGNELVIGAPDELVSRLADRMAEAEVGRAPVVDATGRLVGLVARKDLLAARARRMAEETDHAAPLRLAREARRASRAA